MKAKQPAIGETGWRPTDVHPLAALFPALPDDDLAASADDIKANGLIHPVVIDEAGMLIDERAWPLARKRVSSRAIRSSTATMRRLSSGA